MTIKQQGGIFGRNPTFNDVDVGNDLTVNNNLIVDNKIGVGIASPSQVIHAVNPSTSYVLSETTGTGTSAGFRLKGDASADFTLFTTQGINQFGIYDNANAATRLTINTGGDITVETGNLIIGTSGKGIDFSATSGTGTSELFDDYEEGTWTPAIRYVNSTDNGNATETVQTGKYVKIGRMVMAEWRLDFTQSSGAPAASAVFVTGLPFAGLDNFYNTSGTAVTSAGDTQMRSPLAGATETQLSIDGATLGTGSRIVRGTVIYQAQ